MKTYEISLSNDGVHFGDPEKIHIIDSSCQEPVTVDGQLEVILKVEYQNIYNYFNFSFAKLFDKYRKVVSSQLPWNYTVVKKSDDSIATI